MDEKDLTVLVIDDEALILTLVSSFLRKSRYRPLLTGDFIQARRLCLESEHSIDIVIADVSLPPQGREAFWVTLAELFPHARLVHMSGFTEDQVDVPEWHGPRFFLQKPYKGSDLMAVLERASKVIRSAAGC